MVSFIKNLFSAKVDNSHVRAAYIDQRESQESPWACFEVVGFEKDGRIKVEFNWNPAFIQKLNALGFQAESEEDTVQLFFYTSQMKPTSLGDSEDESVQSDSHPNLSNNSNRMVS
jgi:hypothetical protein